MHIAEKKTSHTTANQLYVSAGGQTYLQADNAVHVGRTVSNHVKRCIALASPQVPLFALMTTGCSNILS